MESRVSSLGGIEQISLFSDASLTGYGFVIKDGDNLVYCSGRVFSEAQWVWHINRKELFSLSNAVQKLDSLLYGFKNLKKVVCATDSRVALAHSNQYKEVASKSIERRVILRLRRGILDLINYWKRYGIELQIQYVKGSENPSDQLSRVTAQTFSDLEIQLAEITSDPPLPSLQVFHRFRDWLTRRSMFRAWRNARSGRIQESDIPSERLLRQFFVASQELDERGERYRQALRGEYSQGEQRLPEVEMRMYFVADDDLVQRRIDDRVMFATDKIKKKFGDQCQGPFRIIEQLGSQTWKVLEERSGKIFVFHARRLLKIEEEEVEGLLTSELPVRETASTTRVVDTLAGKAVVEDNQASTTLRPRQLNKEERFLNTVGGASRYGRVRRGSMSRKF